ncbi:hypothetical protein ACOSP7_030681 [Xanthoceras sorbifolium]
MRHKNEAQSILKRFFNYVFTQFESRIKTFRSDNSGEFISLCSFFHDNGVIFQYSCVYTPQQNGVVERKHRHILQVARALKFHAQLPSQFWGECALTAVHIINQLPSPIRSFKTHFELLYSKPPSYSHLREFGCLAYATNVHTSHKFDRRALPSIFIGYPIGQKAYKLFDLSTKNPNSAASLLDHYSCPIPLLTHDTFDSAFDSTPPNKQSPPPPLAHIIPTSPPAPQTVFDPSPSATIEPAPSDPPSPALGASPTIFDHSLPSPEPSLFSPEPLYPPPEPLRHSSRQITLPIKLNDYVCSNVYFDQSTFFVPGPTKGTRYPLTNYVSYHRYRFAYHSFVAQIGTVTEPRSYSEAVAHPEWQEAMHSELQALKANDTWSLTPLPAGKTPIGCRWVYKIKLKSDGSIERYKTHLVAKGFTQLEGVDYQDAFSPTTKIIYVRCLLALAAGRGWSLHQLDVNNAFLHGDLHEEIYMSPPPRLRRQGRNTRFASRQWFAKFSEAIRWYEQSKADYSLFIRKQGKSFTALLIYVDDILITGNDSMSITDIKKFLHNKFRLKDFGKLKYFFGIEISASRNVIFISQRKYALEIIKDAGLLGAAPINTPMERGLKLSDKSELFKDPGRYRRLVRRLMYLTVSRPNITYSVYILYWFMHQPRKDHWEVALRVVRYLKSAPGQGIFISSTSDLRLQAYSDSDWAGCPLTRRSTTWYCVFLGPSLISWRSKR